MGCRPPNKGTEEGWRGENGNQGSLESWSQRSPFLAPPTSPSENWAGDYKEAMHLGDPKIYQGKSYILY